MSISLREATSEAACWIAWLILGSMAVSKRICLRLDGSYTPRPYFMFTVAAAPFRIPNARMTGGGIRSCGWLILKFSSDRSVCAPQYLSAGTWISPKASVSVLVEPAIAEVDVKLRNGVDVRLG